MKLEMDAKELKWYTYKTKCVSWLPIIPPLYFTPLSENFALVPSTAGVDLMMLASVYVCDRITDKIIFLQPTVSALDSEYAT